MIDLDNIKFNWSELLKGKCDLCQGRGELFVGEEESSTGYGECPHKMVSEVIDVLGVEMEDIKPVESPSSLQPWRHKDILLKASQSILRSNTAWNWIKSHVRRILQDEMELYFQARSQGEPCKRPSWCRITAQTLLDLHFDDEDRGNHGTTALVQEPWVILSIGEEDKRNCYLQECILSFEARRRVAGNTTWVFTKRDDDWIQKRYGIEVVEWLHSLPEVPIRIK